MIEIILYGSLLAIFFIVLIGYSLACVEEMVLKQNRLEIRDVAILTIFAAGFVASFVATTIKIVQEYGNIN